MQPNDKVIQWLLAGDPAIRWQVMRDLLGARTGVVEKERAKVGREGWGKRALALQDAGGMWGRGLYSPKWISTTYTMLLLRDFGLGQSNQQAQKACRLLLDGGMRCDGGVNFTRSEQSETCISGMVLSIVSYFRHEDGRLDSIARHLLEQQMADGGWNCQRSHGATHASFHTTISVLEGLRLYGLCRPGKSRKIGDARRRAHEFLLAHQLFRSDRTGRTIKSGFTSFSFPPRWHYDVLRALDYFQASNETRDRRMAAAMDIVRRRRRPDGRWLLGSVHKGRAHFELERSGAPSRWNTLRALRVLGWWEGRRV